MDVAMNGVDERPHLVTAKAIQVLGALLLRQGLVLVLAWIGAMKFTDFEARAIQPLVANSPLLAWTYGVLTLRGLSNLLGCVELTIAVLIAYSLPDDVRELLAQGCKGFLQKPFLIPELFQKVRQVIRRDEEKKRG